MKMARGNLLKQQWPPLLLLFSFVASPFGKKEMKDPVQPLKKPKETNPDLAPRRRKEDFSLVHHHCFDPFDEEEAREERKITKKRRP